jgi:hypothetical protein
MHLKEVGMVYELSKFWHAIQGRCITVPCVRITSAIKYDVIDKSVYAVVSRVNAPVVQELVNAMQSFGYVRWPDR